MVIGYPNFIYWLACNKTYLRKYFSFHFMFTFPFFLSVKNQKSKSKSKTTSKTVQLMPILSVPK